MENRDTVEMGLSIWWGAAILALMVCGGAVLIARNIGPQAIETLLYTSLMLVFLAGGVLLGALATQALGSSQRWGLADGETPFLEDTLNQKALHSGSVNTDESGPASLLGDDEIDPFYEILKRNRSAKKAA
jgi:hypothetical protein